MAFLFKSKKNQDKALTGGREAREGSLNGSQGSMQSPDARARVAREEKAHRSTPTGSLNSIDGGAGNASPEHGFSAGGPLRRAQTGDVVPQSADIPPQMRNGPAPAPQTSPNSSLYPWSQRKLNFTSPHAGPFPRYGAAANATASKEGDLYIMGGLINSSTVKGDLWMIEAGGSLSCYPLATTAEGPGPRVGHASLLVGNAFIVYGGDTKIEESDSLDETLYLLNTSTRQWSRALPAGSRPSGRYGHTLNILGSKIYIFGGQVEGIFMNDLSAFDLNQLQMTNNRWEMLMLNNDSGAAVPGKCPPARTNHTMVSFNDKMYLFGGTNGFSWFNDVWCYDPATNTWSQLDCIGYIPVPREGHAAALVDDVMYIFGGRTEEGADLGDLAAFRISSRRWYTFQNMGPSPSPRSGHSMTTVGKMVVVVGGEPSQAAPPVNDLSMIYMLDTTKIRYPSDSQIQSQRTPGQRRPSMAEPPPLAASRGLTSREGSQGPPDQRRILAAPREGGSIDNSNGIRSVNGPEPNGVAQRGPRGPIAAGPPPSGPPPQGQPPRPGASARPSRNASLEKNVYGGSEPSQSPSLQQGPENPSMNGRRTGKPGSDGAEAAKAGRSTRQTRGQQSSADSTTEPNMRNVVSPPPGSRSGPAVAAAPAPSSAPAPAPAPTPSQAPAAASFPAPTPAPTTTLPVRPASPPPSTRQVGAPVSRRSSMRNSQTVALLKELDAARNRNAWYASELELARKAGYVANATLSPVLDSRSAETFDDDDKPLIEALLAMRTEVANVQASLDKQAVLAAKHIAEAEKQRDAAIQEAVHAKAKLAATGSNDTADPERDEFERTNELGSKLAVALNAQRELQNALDRMSTEVDAERRARRIADDTVSAAEKRMASLEAYKQQTSSELEQLKAELHMVQREAREQSVLAHESQAALQLLHGEKTRFETLHNEAVGNSKDHTETMESLREAMVASADTKAFLESKLDEERALRETVENKLMSLKSEHEARTRELVTATQRLRDTEELAERHAHEARTHRQVVLAGLDKISTRNISSSDQGHAEKMQALQSQLDAANGLVKKYKQEADAASDKLRAAEERIAGLEAYQEQASREGVTIRRQLQAALRETQSLQAANTELKHQFASQQLESNAINVQHNTLKDILVERGISPTSAVSRTRSITSPRGGSPAGELSRIRDLEKQLAASLAAHEETKQTLSSQSQESEAQYREKLTQLENDYQSAVHYVKGTEKMLRQLKEQLARYKTENSRLKEEMSEIESKGVQAGGEAPADWEIERLQLHGRVEELQSEIKASSAQLEQQLQLVHQQLADTRRAHEDATQGGEEANARLAATKRDLEQLQQENSLLEQRAHEAESKVSMLLDQVENSVTNYRRQSRNMAGLSVADLAQLPGADSSTTNGDGPQTRKDSSDAGSVYSRIEGQRNSAALDNLANELETLRSHWEATNKNYRLSNAFDFETGPTSTGPAAPATTTGTGAAAAVKDEKTNEGLGLSESLADWRKRLDS